MTPHAEAEVRRLLTRFAIERVAAGWSVWDLGKASRVNRSSIDRAESGAVIPDLATLVDMAQPLGLRLDWVPEHLQPLLGLDEIEVASLVRGAGEGWRHAETGSTHEEALTRALRKLGRLTE